MAPTKSVERDFEAAMIDVYRHAWEQVRYRASDFHAMIQRHGGVEAAHRLLREGPAASGFAALLTRGRPDLTMEAMILKEQRFHSLFDAHEHQVARDRMEGKP